MKQPQAVSHPGNYPSAEGYRAARWENMTQPMGPLDAGDQALADAVNRLPALIHEGELDGVRIKTFKDHQPGGDMVSAEFDGSDASHRVDVRMRKDPRTEYVDVSAPDISASMTRFSPDGHELKSTRAYGNNITGDGMQGGYHRKNRAAAQLFKLEVARKIDLAHDNLKAAVVPAKRPKSKPTI